MVWKLVRIRPWLSCNASVTAVGIETPEVEGGSLGTAAVHSTCHGVADNHTEALHKIHKTGSIEETT